MAAWLPLVRRADIRNKGRVNRPLDTLLSDLRLPGHRALAAHWLALHDAAGRRIPALSSIDPLQFAPALKDAWIVDAEEDGRFRMRLGGETLTDWYGFSTRGRLYEEMFGPAALPLVTEQTRRVLQTPCIGYHRVHPEIAERDHTVPAAFERLALPLTDAEGRIRHMIGATRFIGRTDPDAAAGAAGSSDAEEVAFWYPLPASIGA